MSATTILRSISLILALCLSIAVAQTRQDLLQYMKDNHVSLARAADALGLGFGEEGPLFGYNDTFGWIDASLESAYVHVACVSAGVSSQGEFLASGGRAAALERFLELRVANDLSFVPQCNSVSGTRGWVMLRIYVWTVGSDFPVAYHISGEAEFTVNVPEGGSKSLYETAFLGYADSSRVVQQVETTVTEIIREFALNLLKVRIPN